MDILGGIIVENRISLKKIVMDYCLESNSSEIIYSDDETKALFINPYGWETMSNIYIYDIKKEKLELIHKWDEYLACKYADWENHDNILAILGYTYGTIDTGGDLYRINVETKKAELIKQFPPNIQISNFKINKNKLTVSGIKYIDDNYNEYEDYVESFFIM